MKLWSDSFRDGDPVPEANAFAVIDPITHVHLSTNRNPHLAWDEVPAGTQSLVLFCFDVDVPSVGTDVNRKGHTVPFDLPRTDFYHWTLVDIPLGMKSIAEGALSDKVVAKGKSGPDVAMPLKKGDYIPLRQGVNDYTGWFANDPDMAGDYYGYDGPCPPWNDERIHHYIFRIYALDVARFPLEGRFTGPEAMLAIKGHILDEAQMIGCYTLNPDVAQELGEE
jgi:Raf kinase inhibitor-like YbhB/YbcL family protein